MEGEGNCMRRSKAILTCLVALLFLGSLGPVSLRAEGESSWNSLGVVKPPVEHNSSPSVTKDVYTVTNSVYLLAAEKTELVIYPGESVRFTNDTSNLISITTDAKSSNDIRYDYVSYNSEGKVTYDDLAHTGSASVLSKGGTTVITVDYPYPLTVSFNSELSYAYSPVPALLKKTLRRGESYFISNQAYAGRSIMSDATSTNGKRYDYAVYKEDGSLEKSSFDTYTKPSFSVGDSIILTGASEEPVTVGVPYEGFIGYETDEPAYDSVLLYPGESYKFTNVGTKSDRIEHSGTTKDKFDYVVYDANGTETSRGTNTSTMPLVAVGRYMTLTLLTDNPVRVGGPYRSFMGGNRQDDAISRVTLSPGVSYKFTNNGTLRNPVNNNARQVDGLYDYTVYEADGSYYSQGFDSISTPQLPPGGFAIITVQGSVPVTFDYTDDFSAEVSAEPSHFRVTLSQGESYEFTNISSSLRTLRSNATSSNRFDWVEYYPDGTQQGKRENTYTDPQVSSGNSIVVTAVSAPVTFGANYRLFSWKDKPGEAISKQIVRLGESYTFSNTGSKSIVINSDARDVGGIYDAAVYRADGSVYSVSFEETGNVTIPAGGYAIITGQSASPVKISYTDTITVASSANPALLRATVAPGNAYTYKNISNETEFLYSNATMNTNEFAYVIRRPDGTVHSEGASRYTSVQVSAGYTITVTPLAAPITFGAVYTSFTGTAGEDPTVKRVTLYQNESYLFTNLQASPQTLTSDAKASLGTGYDYAIYRADGMPDTAKFDQDGNLSVPANSQVVVTVTTDRAVTFTYGQAFQASPSAEPALLKRVLEPEQRIGFKNIGNFEAKLTTNANISANRYFDFTILDAYGNIVRQGNQTATSHDVPAGGTIQVKTTSANAVLFTAPYRNFEFVHVEEYVFEDLLHRQVLYVYKQAGQSGYYRFTAPETGRYRFATKELQNFAIQPILTLYDQPNLRTALASSNENEQEFGLDYTVLEFDLQAGKTYYLKLEEENALPLELQLMASIMTVLPEAKFNYRPDGRLTEILFPTGDKLIYDYDPNGNLKYRTKKVFPFQ